jgi:hypothetical protein
MTFVVPGTRRSASSAAAPPGGWCCATHSRPAPGRHQVPRQQPAPRQRLPARLPGRGAAAGRGVVAARAPAVRVRRGGVGRRDRHGARRRRHAALAAHRATVHFGGGGAGRPQGIVARTRRRPRPVRWCTATTSRPNVCVDQPGQSKLADFGIATRSGRDVPVAGTRPTWHRAVERGTATPASDIYAATPRSSSASPAPPPYRPPPALPALALQHMRAPIPVERAPAAVHGLLNQGLAKDPRTGRRMHQLLASLERWPRLLRPEWETADASSWPAGSRCSRCCCQLGRAAGIAARRPRSARAAGLRLLGRHRCSLVRSAVLRLGSCRRLRVRVAARRGSGPVVGRLHARAAAGAAGHDCRLVADRGTASSSAPGVASCLLLGASATWRLRPAALATDIPTALTV